VRKRLDSGPEPNQPTETMDALDGEGTRRLDRPDAGLVVLYADHYEKLPPAFVLDGDVAMIGREAPAANIVIPLATVSRVHARLAREGSRWTIRDLSSRNGLMIRGRAVDEAVLEPSDEVRIGNAVLKFVSSGAAAHRAYRIDGFVAPGAAGTIMPGAVGGLQMVRVSIEVERISPSALPVLVLGETGTGKELIAHAIHAKSGRSGPFLALNCAAIPANLVESELFGYKRGAFTGASRDHLGILRAANGGTLLLDEIGDMPLHAQAKLLRTLETRTVVPVGSVASEPVDVRIVAATHRDLRALSAARHFREDLFARLNGCTITLPPLRDRKEDLFMLVRHWLRMSGAGDRQVSFAFMLAMCHYHWPHNVRELALTVKRAVTFADGGSCLDAQHLPEALVDHVRALGEPDEPGPATGPNPMITPARKREARPSDEQLVDLLALHRGNVSAVARALGKDRGLVDRWIRAAHLDPASFRDA
jgi:transcriptional regulator of acetoin/glycerol metabolism